MHRGSLIIRGRREMKIAREQHLDDRISSLVINLERGALSLSFSRMKPLPIQITLIGGSPRIYIRAPRTYRRDKCKARERENVGCFGRTDKKLRAPERWKRASGYKRKRWDILERNATTSWFHYCRTIETKHMLCTSFPIFINLSFQ